MANQLPRRRPDGTLLPGHSLNPSGRPKIVSEIQELARSAAPAAFEKIVALIGSTDERTALAASQEILNRAYGRPVMQVQSDVRTVNFSSLLALASKQGAQRRGADAPPDEATTIIDVKANEAQQPPQENISSEEW